MYERQVINYSSISHHCRLFEVFVHFPFYKIKIKEKLDFLSWVKVYQSFWILVVSKLLTVFSFKLFSHPGYTQLYQMSSITAADKSAL